MEDTLQKVFGILLAVVVFFLLPLYMAFEKKDDISYSMALRITSNFVDNIANKGYISKEMYLDYVSDLALTDNAYEITFQHTAKKYYPVIYGNKADGTKVKYDYNECKTKYDEYLKGNDVDIDDVNYKQNTNNTLLLNYSLEQIQHTEKEILGFLEGDIEHSDVDTYLIDGNLVYPMSKGDEFTVVIKNTNTTIASILFNTLTMGINQDENTKIYINYGGTVQNESYRKNKLTGESTDVNDTRTETEQSVTFGDPTEDLICEISTDSPNPTNISKVKYKIKFNKEVTGFTVDDIHAGNIIKQNFSGSGSEYEVTLNSTGSGEQKIKIPADVCEDIYGNKNLESQELIIVYDNDLPEMSNFNYSRKVVESNKWEASVSGEVRDNSGKVTINYYIKAHDAQQYQSVKTQIIEPCTFKKTFNYTYTGLNTSKSYNLKIEIIDDAGNVRVKEQVVTPG